MTTFNNNILPHLSTVQTTTNIALITSPARICLCIFAHLPATSATLKYNVTNHINKFCQSSPSLHTVVRNSTVCSWPIAGLQYIETVFNLIANDFVIFIVTMVTISQNCTFLHIVPEFATNDNKIILIVKKVYFAQMLYKIIIRNKW